MRLIIVAGVALFFGWIFGYMTCAVFSINRTNEDWDWDCPFPNMGG